MFDETAPKCTCPSAKSKESGSKSDTMSRCCTKQKLWSMLRNKYFTDICFIVGCEPEIKRIEAHKSVLSASSSVFEAMFSKNWSAESNEIEISDIEPPIFSALLRFMYTDDIQLTSDSVMKILHAAKKYEVIPLENVCSEFLKEHLSAENACSLLTQAKFFDQSDLIALCMKVIDEDAMVAFQSEGFTGIDLATLCEILKRDSLKMKEVSLFQAVLRWSVVECKRRGLPGTTDDVKSILEPAIKLIRFPQMTLNEFASIVLPSDLLSKDEIKDLVSYYGNAQDLSLFNNKHRFSQVLFVADRFETLQDDESEGSWLYGGDVNDAIGFSFDQNVQLKGFGLHHSVGGSGEDYRVDITLKNQETEEDIVCQHDVCFYSDEQNFTGRFFLEYPVKLTANTCYAVIIKIQGPDSCYGTEGKVNLCVEDEVHGRKVNITFFNVTYENSQGRTNVNHGQIPEILFSW